MSKEIDPEGSELRGRYRLKTRGYVNQDPDYAWHLDRYDKLKPFGFAIHGAVDGYSRKVLWLKVLRSINLPNDIEALYLSCVEELQSAPFKIIIDLGTENALAAAIQSFFRQDANAHQYVPSPRNQSVGCWWSYFCKCCAGWWREFFKYMESTETVSSDIVFQLFYKRIYVRWKIIGIRIEFVNLDSKLYMVGQMFLLKFQVEAEVKKV